MPQTLVPPPPLAPPTQRDAILGVILAGGQARRMGGGDKGRLTLDAAGTTLFDAVIARLAPQCGGLVLNANGPAARFDDLGLPVLADDIAEYPGPLAGVLAGMEHAARRGFSHVLSAAADTPFLPRMLGADLAREMRAQNRPIGLAATYPVWPDDMGDGRAEGPGEGPQNGRAQIRRQPTFGLWPVALRADLRAAILAGVSKIVLWTDRHGTALALYPDRPQDPFFNVNTEEDLTRARQIAALDPA